MKRFFAAIAFLTRAPLPARWRFDAADVGRATLFFPLVGAGLGLISCALLRLFELGGVIGKANGSGGQQLLRALVVAALLVTLSAWLTGALHLDGLADMTDGFGGGHSREDVLRIMRDHAVGAFGASALILLLVLKVTAIGALIEAGAASSYLVIAPALARWATVPLGRLLPYARRAEGGLGSAVTDHVGWTEVGGASVIAVALAFTFTTWQSAVVCWLAVIVATSLNGWLCWRRIGGITGDTLGANTEICETLVLVVAVMLMR